MAPPSGLRTLVRLGLGAGTLSLSRLGLRRRGEAAAGCFLRLSLRGLAAKAPGAEKAAARAAASAGKGDVPGILPRFPEPNAGGLLRFLDYVGTVAFASSGALTASAAGMDALGCGMVGTITAVGGGTVRDILLGKSGPCFWMAEPEYLYLCLATTAATFIAWPRIEQSPAAPKVDSAIEVGDFLGAS